VPEGVPGFTQKQADDLAAFFDGLQAAAPTFRLEVWFPETAAGQG